MDKIKRSCPVLADLSTYNPDTIDLINNAKDRNYWLPCLDIMAKKFIDRAQLLNPDMPDATLNAERSYEAFAKLVLQFRDDPSFLPELSIRTLLLSNEQTLRDNNFRDAWYIQKKQETCEALKEFKRRIGCLDKIDDFGNRWLQIATGVLAGNMFDWGARAVTNILEVSANFGLYEAMDTIEKRPWFVDDFESWIRNVKSKLYNTIVIFVDNAGVDFILGILPFARELLKSNSRIVLTANSEPALNDLTIRELKECLRKASEICPIIAKSLANNQLIAVENGQSGPCLDLRYIDSDLCDIMETADLIVLEGMGRAVHTNFNAKFKIDSLKLAVLKNEFLAKSLGARQFSVIFKYEPISCS